MFTNQVVFITVLVVLFSLGCSAEAPHEFDPHSMRLLNVQYSADSTDTKRLNAVFRSNVPVINKVLVYDQVVAAMQETALRDAKVILPVEDIYIVDVTLLYVDDTDLQVEFDYFKKNPTKGQVLSYPIHGQSENPDSFSADQIKKKVESVDWMTDDLTTITDEVQKWFNDFSGTSNIYVLVHCRHGHDRAGEVSSAYWLAHGYKSWEQVQGTNYRIAGGPIKDLNQRALTWYCHHLQSARGYGHLTCTHENLGSKKVVPELAGWDGEDSSRASYFVAIPILASFCGFFLLTTIALILALVIVLWRLKSRHSKLSSTENAEEIDV